MQVGMSLGKLIEMSVCQKCNVFIRSSLKSLFWSFILQRIWQHFLLCEAKPNIETAEPLQSVHLSPYNSDRYTAILFPFFPDKEEFYFKHGFF